MKSSLLLIHKILCGCMDYLRFHADKDELLRKKLYDVEEDLRDCIIGIEGVHAYLSKKEAEERL